MASALTRSQELVSVNAFGMWRNGRYRSRQLHDAIMSAWSKISDSPHLVEHMPWRIKAFLKVKKVQPGMSKAYLMNWLLSFCVRISLNANCLEWLFRSNWYIFLSIHDKKTLLDSHFPHSTKMYSNCFFQVHKVYNHIFTYERQEPEDIWYFSV